MNTDEMKSVWKAYQDRLGASAQWSEEELLQLVNTATVVAPWYRLSQRALVNVCVSLLLLSLTSGC